MPRDPVLVRLLRRYPKGLACTYAARARETAFQPIRVLADTRQGMCIGRQTIAVRKCAVMGVPSINRACGGAIILIKGAAQIGSIEFASAADCCRCEQKGGAAALALRKYGMFEPD